MDSCANIVFTKTPINDFTYFITDFAAVTQYGPWTTSIPACGSLTYSVTLADGTTPLSYPLTTNTVAKTITTYTDDILYTETLYTVQVRA